MVVHVNVDVVVNVNGNVNDAAVSRSSRYSFPMQARAAVPLSLALSLCTVALFVACNEGTTPGDAIGHTRAGLGCYTDPQCGLDKCNLALFPGGACVGTCDSQGACPYIPDAGPPQVCLGEPNTGACLRGCESDGGCIRDGWLCQPTANGGNVCLPDCRTDAVLCASVGTDFQCSTSDGICRVSLAADAGLFGDCNGLEECQASAICLALSGQQGDGGFCTVPCTTAGGDTCPSGGACVVSQGLADGGSEDLCGVPCGTETDGGPGCQSGLSCQQFAGGTMPDGGTIWLALCAP